MLSWELIDVYGSIFKKGVYNERLLSLALDNIFDEEFKKEFTKKDNQISIESGKLLIDQLQKELHEDIASHIRCWYYVIYWMLKIKYGNQTTEDISAAKYILEHLGSMIGSSAYQFIPPSLIISIFEQCKKDLQCDVTIDWQSFPKNYPKEWTPYNLSNYSWTQEYLEKALGCPEKICIMRNIPAYNKEWDKLGVSQFINQL